MLNLNNSNKTTYAIEVMTNIGGDAVLGEIVNITRCDDLDIQHYKNLILAQFIVDLMHCQH